MSASRMWNVTGKNVMRASVLGWLSASLLAGAGLACNAEGDGGPQQTLPGGLNPSNLPGNVVGGSGGTGSAVADPNDPGTETGWTSSCAAPELGEPGLRRLNRREIEQSLRDIFPSLGAAWSSSLSE